MPNPEFRPLESLGDKLQSRHADMVEDTYKLIDARMDWSLTHAGDWGKVAVSQLKGVYMGKAKELKKECEKLQASVAVEVQEEILIRIRQRLDLMLQIAGGARVEDDLDTVHELDRLGREGMAIINNTDVQGLIYNYLKERENKPAYAGLADQYLVQVGREIRPDTYPVLEKVAAGREDFTDADWKVLTYYVHGLFDKNLSNAQRNMGLALIGSLSPASRLTFLEKMENDPLLPDLIPVMVSYNYLQVDQAQAFLGKRLANPKLKPEARKNLEKLVAEVSSPEMKRRQEQIEKAKKEAPKHMATHQFGHTNTARNMLTFRNIGGAAVALNGAATIFANVLVDLKEPWNLPTNPGFLIGVAELGVGMEVTKGFQGLAPQPTKLIAKALGEEDEETDDAQKDMEDALRRSLGRYTMEAPFYYTLADKIMDAHKKQMQLQKTTRPNLKFKDLGIRWADLPQEYKTISESAYEKRMSEWAGTFYQDFKIVNFGTEKGGQKWKMNEKRKEAQLPPYEDDKRLRDLLTPKK